MKAFIERMPGYYRGYPRRQLKALAKGVALSFGCLSPLIALAAAGAFARFASFRQHPGPIDLSLGIVAAVAAIFFVLALISSVQDSLVGRIVPYFDKRLGLNGVGQFNRGAALARNCRQLDALATRLGLQPISSFGFPDDMAGEKIEWHPSREGLDTITSLREQLGTMPDFPDREDVLQDLSVMQRALAEAMQQDRSFCFILRGGMDKFISPLEMDRRKGSFW